MGVYSMMRKMEFDRRKKNRIRAEDLPDSLKRVKICLNSEDKMTAETLDISSKGIGLLVPRAVKDINGIFVTIYSTDQSIKVKEQILAVRSVDDTTSRVSIMFAKQNPFFELLN
jgi:c-di-GMP-binding flagellar brake protein YcgR